MSCRTVAYVGTWSRYRPEPYNFLIEHLDPSLFTHLIYSFAGLEATTCEIMCLDQWQDIDDGIGGYKKATGLRARNPDLKVLIAIGGWNEDCNKYSKMAASPENRKRFITSVVSFLSRYGFDGLDLDWEYPGHKQRGGCSGDKHHFATLVQELRQEFERQGRGWMLTAALGAGKDTINNAYDIKSLSRDLDLMNVMTYDYHGDWDGKVGVNTPLHSQTDNLSVEDTLKHLLSLGAPKEKLVLGLAMYGKTFTMTSSTSRGIGSPCTEGLAGSFTKQPGMVAYYEVCEMKKQGWSEHWHEPTNTPYITKDDNLISYDDVRSFKIKVDYARGQGINSFMCWSVDMDDFLGVSGVKFPLLKAIKF